MEIQILKFLDFEIAALSLLKLKELRIIINLIESTIQRNKQSNIVKRVNGNEHPVLQIALPINLSRKAFRNTKRRPP